MGLEQVTGKAVEAAASKAVEVATDMVVRRASSSEAVFEREPMAVTKGWTMLVGPVRLDLAATLV